MINHTDIKISIHLNICLNKYSKSFVNISSIQKISKYINNFRDSDENNESLVLNNLYDKENPIEDIYCLENEVIKENNEKESINNTIEEEIIKEINRKKTVENESLKINEEDIEEIEEEDEYLKKLEQSV